ncbi:iron uptake porin [Pseudanabaena sp. FACHB-2040]|nr:iron uptake porin [Pseudanabaena sp. FACHB-2040]
MSQVTSEAQSCLPVSDGWQKLLLKTGLFLLVFAAPVAASEQLKPLDESWVQSADALIAEPDFSHLQGRRASLGEANPNRSDLSIQATASTHQQLPSPSLEAPAALINPAGPNESWTTAQEEGTELAQLTSIGELSDVLPSDWAYQALQKLVEDYSCLVGYPNASFQGQAALTRYEFAAGLNACLNALSALVAPGPRPDIDILSRLQAEFRVELATLRQRVDDLEVAAAELEANQFATMTKLRGNVFAFLGNGFTSGGIRAEGLNAFTPARDPVTLQPVVRTVEGNTALNYGYLTFLNMDTSFTGSDRLNLQLVAGNGTAPANFYVSAGLFNTFGTPFTFQNGSVTPDDFAVRELSYSFPVGDRITVDIGPRINWYRYFDNNRYTFFVTGANSFNSSGGTQVNAVDRGAGAIAVWNPTNWLDFRLGYLAESNEFLPGLRPPGNPAVGLFGGTNTLTAQVGIRPTNNLNLRLLYTRSSLAANAAGLVGGSTSEPFYGFADDGLGGPLSFATADTFLVNFDWQVTDWLGFFGRYSYGSTNLQPATLGRAPGEINGYSFQLGVAFPDLFKEGALATISYLQPFNVTAGRNFLVSGGGDGGVQHEVELSYRYPLSQNLALIPSFYWIGNANNFSDNPDIFLLSFQTQFFF